MLSFQLVASSKFERFEQFALLKYPLENGTWNLPEESEARNWPIKLNLKLNFKLNRRNLIETYAFLISL